MPELQFFYDQSIAQHDRIERILQELERTTSVRDEHRCRRDDDDPTTTTQRRAASADVARSATRSIARQRFLITSHARPDGDSIGSQLAMAYALDALGKEVRLVNADPAPDHYLDFPGVDRIEIARASSRPTPTR